MIRGMILWEEREAEVMSRRSSTSECEKCKAWTAGTVCRLWTEHNAKSEDVFLCNSCYHQLSLPESLDEMASRMLSMETVSKDMVYLLIAAMRKELKERDEKIGTLTSTR